MRYVVLLGLCLAAALAYVHRACFGVAESTIRAELGLNEKQSGWVMGIFFWTYALFQIPTGLLADTWGPRRALFLFGMTGAVTLALGAGTLLAGGLVAFAVLLVSRSLMGVAQAGLFPASTRCIAFWFPLSERGLATGALQSCMQVGAMFAAAVTGWLIGVLPWQWMFVVFALPGVLWSYWFYDWFRDHPEEHPSTNAAERELLAQPPGVHAPSGARGPTPWLRLFGSAKVFWLCTQQFFRAGANVFWLTWSPTFFQKVFLVTPAESGLLTVFPTVGVVFGSFTGGVVADRVLRATGSRRWSRQGVAVASSAIGITLFVLAYADPLHIYPAVTGVGSFAPERPLPAGAYAAAVLMLFAAYFVSMGNPCAYSVAIDIGGRFTAVVFGAMNMAGNIGAFLFPVLLPFWVDDRGWSTVPLFVGSIYLVSLCCWLPLNPNGRAAE